MKFLFLLIIFFTFLTEANTANTKLRKYETYLDQITWKHLKFNLPNGEWLYYSKDPWSLENFHGSCVNFLNVEKKIINGHYQICYIQSGGKWRNLLGSYLQAEWKKNKYDNCTLRPEYFYVKSIFKGASSNCYVSRHIDPNKEIYFPDDPNDTSARLKKFIRDRSLKLPKIMLSFESIYYSNLRDKAISMSVAINPEAYGANKTLYDNEIDSEYHRNKINKYLDKKNFITNWTKKMSIQHSLLEDQLEAKIDFKLNFLDLNDIQNNYSSSFIKDLNKLNELYKSGILNATEFEKAKKKLLN